VNPAGSAVRPALWAGGAIVAALSCTSGRPPAAAGSDTAAAATVAAAPVPADSLAASAPGGLEVWFTMARNDRGADGRLCTDRTLEIRRGPGRVAVPLLYTGEAPRIVNDTTLEAVLYRGCRPLARYRVDTRTGQPTPMRPAS
jgi:hypothetical protein